MKETKIKIRQGLLHIMVLLLCVVGLLNGKAMVVEAEELVTADGYQYAVLANGTVEIMGYTGTETELVIPDKIDGKSVTKVDSLAFALCSSMTEIVLPENLKSIGIQAFALCDGITSITIPKGVISIGEGAFGACDNLSSIQVDSGNTVYNSNGNCNAIIETATKTLVHGCANSIIPEGVQSIGDGAFSECAGLTSITIPSGVTSIGDAAFQLCSYLKSITIPDSVTSIGATPFYKCHENFVIYATPNSYAYKWAQENGHTVKAINATPAAKGNTLTDTANTCKVKVTSANKTNPTVAYVGTTDKNAKNIKIPSKVTVDGVTYTVTSVGDKAFQGKKITQVTIPKTVKIVGKNAFKKCKKLTKVTIDTGVTEIKASAFENCTALKAVTIKSKTLKTIGKKAFKGCKNLKTITIKSTKLTKKSAGSNALKGTNKKLTIKVSKKYVKKYKTYFKNKGNKTVKVKKG